MESFYAGETANKVWLTILPSKASFVEPLAVTIDEQGIIYVADGNTFAGNRTQIFFPFVETITAPKTRVWRRQIIESKV